MAQWFDLAIQAFTFLAVFAVVNMAQRAVVSQLAVRRRLGREEVSGPQLAERSVLRDRKVSHPFLLWVQSATAGGEGKEAQKLRADLSLAGFDQPSAPIWYVIIRFSLAIGAPMLLIAGAAMAGRPLTGLGAFIFPLAVCGAGLIAPKAVLDNRAGARREQLEHEFPDALDLMVVCVEAGLGLEAAFVRVAAEVKESHPRIAEEFTRLADELSAGRGRAEALRALADRLNVDSIRAFVALLIQTDQLGVSIGQSLRTYSAEMRESRFMKAEEKAMRIPVLMTMPIVACFMPVIMVALLLPPAIDVIRTLMPALSGR